MVKSSFNEIANLFIRTMVFEKAGDMEQDGGHVHTYDHAHFVSNGSLKISLNGEETEYKAPSFIFIPAGVMHSLTALEDNSIGHCIHALRSQDKSGEPMDPSVIPKGVSALLFSDPITEVANTVVSNKGVDIDGNPIV